MSEESILINKLVPHIYNENGELAAITFTCEATNYLKAAPDMYRALDALLHYAEKGCGSPTILDQAAAALRKARGEEVKDAKK